METIGEIIKRAGESLIGSPPNGEPPANDHRASPKKSGSASSPKIRQREYCPTCRGAGFLRDDVDYTHSEFGRPVGCPDCHDGNLATRLRAASQLTGWLQDATLKGFDVKPDNREAYQAIWDYVGQKPPCGWLSVWGGFGVGKTHLLAGIVNWLNVHSIGAVYYTLPDLLDLLREAVSDDKFSPRYTRLLNIQVLCIDEVDKARMTEWAHEKLYQLCDARYRKRLEQGSIFASNVKPDPNDQHLGYLYSRMSEGVVVHVGGGDIRPLRRER